MDHPEQHRSAGHPVPHDNSVIGRAAQALPADVDRAVAAARRAFDEGPWPHTPPADRIAALRRLASLREKRADEIAALITAENGSALWFTEAGQSGLTRQANAFLTAAAEFGWETTLEPSDPAAPFRSVVRREAIGVVAVVIPWNSPFSSALAKIIPALLAGNTVVLKVSPENTLSMNLLAELLADKVAFTGSTRAGRRIAALAGEQLKRVSLEPGGKSAAIILPDADLDAAVQGVKFGSLLNNGESCIAQTRILAPRSRYEEVVAGLQDLIESLPVGDPAAEGTFVGPMVRRDQQQRVLDYIRLGVEDDAVRIANDSEYDLSGGVWSADPAHALAVARRVRTGTVTVNGAPIGFDGPFGGFKASGLGREYGATGIGTYTEYKTITVPSAAHPAAASIPAS